MSCEFSMVLDLVGESKLRRQYFLYKPKKDNRGGKFFHIALISLSLQRIRYGFT